MTGCNAAWSNLGGDDDGHRNRVSQFGRSVTVHALALIWLRPPSTHRSPEVRRVPASRIRRHLRGSVRGSGSTCSSESSKSSACRDCHSCRCGSCPIRGIGTQLASFSPDFEGCPAPHEVVETMDATYVS